MRKKPTKKWIIATIVVLAVLLVIGIVLGICLNANSLKKASKNLTKYSISATISDNKISAKQVVEYKNDTKTTLNNICFHLYPRAFREDATIKPYTDYNSASCFPDGISYGDIDILSVKDDDNPSKFELVGEDQDILQVNLAKPLNKNKKVKIQIEFSVIIPNGTHRLGAYDGTINLGGWYPIVCYYSGGWQKTPYYSTGDPFVSNMANYVVEIKYPQEYSCYGTGEKVNSGAGYSKFNALAVRDFALLLSNKSQELSQTENKTKVTYVGYKGDTDIKQNLQLSVEALKYFNSSFGKYPYSTLTVVKSAFVHGGMEYPNIVIVSDAVTDAEGYNKVIVHEIAHQWWYNLVGNNQITEAWLDESLAEYSTCLFFEDHTKYGISYSSLVKDATASYLIYTDVLSGLEKKIKTNMNLAVNQYNNEYEYSYMIYVKGIIMFDTLRDGIGKKSIVAGLKKYFKKNCYKMASSSDFISAMESASHKKLANFFSGWLGGTSVVGKL